MKRWWNKIPEKTGPLYKSERRAKNRGGRIKSSLNYYDGISPRTIDAIIKALQKRNQKEMALKNVAQSIDS